MCCSCRGACLFLLRNCSWAARKRWPCSIHLTFIRSIVLARQIRAWPSIVRTAALSVTTEQVQQTGVACEVVLTSVGKKNPSAVSNLVATLKLSGLTEEQAENAAGKITDAGGKTETHIVATGPDISRGWGLRHSVAEDFLYDSPRAARQRACWAGFGGRWCAQPGCEHCFTAPLRAKKYRERFVMPPFRYLFETKKIGATPSPEALNLPAAFAPAAGYESCRSRTPGNWWPIF